MVECAVYVTPPNTSDLPELLETWMVLDYPSSLVRKYSLHGSVGSHARRNEVCGNLIARERIADKASRFVRIGPGGEWIVRLRLPGKITAQLRVARQIEQSVPF